jgi:hypothetical protein
MRWEVIEKRGKTVIMTKDLKLTKYEELYGHNDNVV